MLVAEEKLAVQVAQVDGVEIDDVDFTEAGESEVLEKLAANAASAHHEHARLPPVSNPGMHWWLCRSRTFSTMPCSVPPRLCFANLSRAIAIRVVVRRVWCRWASCHGMRDQVKAAGARLIGDLEVREASTSVLPLIHRPPVS